MSNDKDLILQDGEIFETLSNTMFRVRIKNGHEVLATVSGKMKMKYVKMVIGDKVKIEMSPYDLTRGRITSRIDDKKYVPPVYPTNKRKKR